jgi:hypothetical protein
MAGKKRKSTDERELAPRGDAAGLATIRMLTNALETAMIERYVGNAPTLKPIRAIVRGALRDIRKIKPLAMSDCPDQLVHQPDCNCEDPALASS